MALTPDEFTQRLGTLREGLGEQGRRARALVQAAFDAFFHNSHDQAREAIALDNEIDAFDVELEQHAVALLTEAARETTPLSEEAIRRALTLVKVNNELERIADCGVTIAEAVLSMKPDAGPALELFPPTARVMTNSVVGMLRDIARAYGSGDAQLARLVLQSEDVVAVFKTEITRKAERDVAAGSLPVELAFDLHELASQCTLMADHATNIAEQVIYEATGTIVRHREGKWVVGDLG
ncbi:MAG: PhoU domain-containing protein [Planctomycetota bacterium]